ncbi:MAG: phosphoglycerate kinase [Psychroflexus sp.]|nr:phosphoglycerate kinase [Psychroflexus sp.]
MKTIDELHLNNKKVLIRVDFNVPLNNDLEVTDSSRIEAAKPTISKVLEKGGKPILMSHLGRPKAREKEFSLANVSKKATQILGQQVNFVEDSVGDKVKKAIADLPDQEILLLENLRYYSEEKAGDENFAKQLSELADVYINDAFGTAHRAHASTTIVAKFFQEKGMGYLLKNEIDSLEKVMKAKEKPVTAIIGGAKVSSKIGVIENILPRVDHLIIGGGMSFTFVKARGGKIGDSLVEDDKLDLAKNIMGKAKENNVQLHLPVDVLAADEFKNDANTKVFDIGEIDDHWMGMDAGPNSKINFSDVIAQSKIILWNGPIGVFEMEPFSKGTKTIGNAIAKATANGAFSLVGGGDSVAAAKQFGIADKMSYVSTGGGAMLEMLEGKSLPGIEALK